VLLVVLQHLFGCFLLPFLVVTKNSNSKLICLANSLQQMANQRLIKVTRLISRKTSQMKQLPRCVKTWNKEKPTSLDTVPFCWLNTAAVFHAATA
jgi:hypothetical protein